MDERLRILQMVEDGTVTAQQAAELMSAMDLDLPAAQAAQTGSYDKKLLRVIVDSTEGDKANIQFPVGAIKKILNATGQLPIPKKDLQGIDLSSMMDAVSECLDTELEGDLVNFEDSDGTTVRIYVD